MYIVILYIIENIIILSIHRIKSTTFLYRQLKNLSTYLKKNYFEKKLYVIF